MSSAVVLALRLSEAGWAELAIATPQQTSPSATIFWCAVTFGAGMSVTLLIIGLMLQLVWSNQTGVWTVYYALIPTILPNSIATCQFGILVRDGRLTALAVTQAIAEILGTTVGVFFLFTGAGLLSLVYARLVTALTTVVIAVALVKWVPKPNFDRGKVIEAFRYASSLIGARVVGFINGYGAEFLIGAFLGLREVGQYRVASRIAGAVAEVIYEPLRVVAWRTIAAAGQRADREREVALCLESTITVGSFIYIPLFLGLSFVAPDLLAVVLGRGEWLAAAPIVSILAIAKLFGVLFLYTESTLTVMHKHHWIPRLALSSAFLSLGCTSITGVFFPSTVAIAWAQIVASGLIGMSVALALRRFVPWRMRAVLTSVARAAIGGLAMLSILWVAKTGLNASGISAEPVRLLVYVICGAGSFVAVMGKEPWIHLRQLVASHRHANR